MPFQLSNSEILEWIMADDLKDNLQHIGLLSYQIEAVRSAESIERRDLLYTAVGVRAIELATELDHEECSIAERRTALNEIRKKTGANIRPSSQREYNYPPTPPFSVIVPDTIDHFSRYGNSDYITFRDKVASLMYPEVELDKTIRNRAARVINFILGYRGYFQQYEHVFEPCIVREKRNTMTFMEPDSINSAFLRDREVPPQTTEDVLLFVRRAVQTVTYGT